MPVRKFDKLLSPIDLGPFAIKNRVMMGSMHTGLEEEKDGFKRMAAFYAARASGGVGLIVTGGIAPSRQGWLAPFGAKMSSKSESKDHRIITEAVHKANGRIVMQILHSGRYGYHPFTVAPSRIKSPITPFTPWKMSKIGIVKVMHDFCRTAGLAKEAGYDGIEIMGSEGYLINQFIVTPTNQRTDSFGGGYKNRMRFPLELVKRVREEVGEDFLLIFRLSMIDLVEKGSTFEEVIQLGLELEAAGINVINTGIGWHESRIPTIATSVPRRAFTWVTAEAKKHLNVPLITSNRINDPTVAELILQEGEADIVSMARPLLADADFVNKAAAGRAETINTCIACNQACLDHIFKQKIASCLVNPKACFETKLVSKPVTNPKKVAVVGAGVAGLACAVEAAAQGHFVSLYEKADQIGGQFLMAARIPGKEEFSETLRYFRNMLDDKNVTLYLNKSVTVEELLEFEEVVIATGVNPRRISLQEDSRSSNFVSYPDVLNGKVKIGNRVAVIGAGGIGFDVCEFLLHEHSDLALNREKFMDYWGVDMNLKARGAITNIERNIPAPKREIYLLQRKTTKFGSGLGKTTGWIHRQMLKDGKVKMLGGVDYLEANNMGLKIKVDNKEQVLQVDHIVVCAGQVSETSLWKEIHDRLPLNSHLIGGAHIAAELDAKAAIKEGIETALKL